MIKNRTSLEGGKELLQRGRLGFRCMGDVGRLVGCCTCPAHYIVLELERNVPNWWNQTNYYSGGCYMNHCDGFPDSGSACFRSASSPAGPWSCGGSWGSLGWFPRRCRRGSQSSLRTAALLPWTRTASLPLPTNPPSRCTTFPAPPLAPCSVVCLPPLMFDVCP